MTLKVKALEDCCWKYLSGINNTKISYDDFRIAMVRAFNEGSSDHYWQPKHLPGAMIFCGSHSGDAITVYGDTVNKKEVENSLETVCSFVEDNNLGEIVEIPTFKNPLHKSQIVPRLWLINEKELLTALPKWFDEVGTKRKGNFW